MSATSLVVTCVNISANGRVVARMKHRSDLPSNIVLNREVLPLVGQDSTGDGLEGAKH